MQRHLLPIKYRRLAVRRLRISIHHCDIRGVLRHAIVSDSTRLGGALSLPCRLACGLQLALTLARSFERGVPLPRCVRGAGLRTLQCLLSRLERLPSLFYELVGFPRLARQPCGLELLPADGLFGFPDGSRRRLA
jgi:hypothetical protein